MANSMKLVSTGHVRSLRSCEGRGLSYQLRLRGARLQRAESPAPHRVAVSERELLIGSSLMHILSVWTTVIFTATVELSIHELCTSTYSLRIAYTFTREYSSIQPTGSASGHFHAGLSTRYSGQVGGALCCSRFLIDVGLTGATSSRLEQA